MLLKSQPYSYYNQIYCMLMRPKFSCQIIFTYKLHDTALFTILNPGDQTVDYIQNVERIIKRCIH